MAEPLIYVNGELVPKSEAKISVFDEGVTHGWAVYEGIRVYDGRIVELDAHVKRLYASAKGAGIKIPLSPGEFRDAVIETVRANGYRDCHLAPWVGYGEVGGEPSVVIRIREVGTRMGEPLTAVVSSVRRAAPDSIPAQIKTNSRLDLMLAKVEAQVAGADYAIMLDHTGYVSEASLANLMIVKNDVVYTPYATSALEGVTRNLLLCLLPMNGVEACEGNITLQDLWTADEAFICGTGAEIRPITMVDGRTIGDGGTGPVTRKAIKLYETYIRENGE
ncbi:aminotransferase class IV, partial [Candidatus Bathyarchaeota archaeon]|nr:aminotransferase class IV [Candidatus Bathyarchaeota archaeon]